MFLSYVVNYGLLLTFRKFP